MSQAKQYLDMPPATATEAALLLCMVPLPPQQRLFLNAILAGMKPRAACHHIDISYKTYLSWTKSDPQFRGISEEVTALLDEESQISRLDVIRGIKEGIEVGMVTSNANAMIKGWETLGRMGGHLDTKGDGPTINILGVSVAPKLRQMSERELLEQSGVTIEGETE